MPRGHPTVVFTEPQIYHSLRVFTDETLRMSHATIEQMVLDAVRGRRTAMPSRTDHFRKKTFASTPFRQAGSDSSDSDAETFTSGESDGQELRCQAVSGDSSFSGESDSSGEMALITASYKTATQQSRNRSKPITTAVDGELKGQETDMSSQDVTRSEVREHTLSGKSKRSTHGKRPQKSTRQPQPGIRMREEFFGKVGWTRSIFSGPADAIHNPHTVWCHMCKKTFSSNPKTPLRFSDTTERRST